MFSIFVYMYYMHACSALEEIVQDRTIEEATPILHTIRVHMVESAVDMLKD